MAEGQLGEPAAVARLLRRHGITPTRQRVEIARAILRRPQHLTADQVLQLTQQAGGKVSKATVYNTLGLPVAAGILYPFFGILLSPIIAAAAMAASSVTVITNANRLRYFKP